MSRPQPYRIDWTQAPSTLEDCSAQLATQFESIDQMFQLLFEDLGATDTTAATGVLPVLRGGTEATGVTVGGVAYGSSGAVTGAAYAFSAAGTSQTLLISNGTGAPTFGAADLSGAGIGGVLPLARGGTNATGSATTGGVAYGDGTKFAFTAAGTAGQVLLSSGTAAPLFGVVGLVTGVTGILPLTLGGTNATGAAVTGGVIYSDATKWLASAAGTAGHFLKSSGTAAPVFSQIDLATTGVSGILAVGNGGTGLTTLAAGRIPYGSGASAFASTGTLTFSGNALGIGVTPTVGIYLQVNVGAAGNNFSIQAPVSLGSGCVFASINDDNSAGMPLEIRASIVRIVGSGNTAIDVSATGAVKLSQPPQFAGTNVTGTGVTVVGTNNPAVTPNAPYTWIQAVAADGSTVYIPCWK